MKVYTIDTQGYIVGIKTVGKNYVLGNDDIEGIPLYDINYHYETGIKKPLTQEQIDVGRTSELKELISNKKLLDMDCTKEQTELKGLLGGEYE